MRNYRKNNAWNIRRLVDELFVPANNRTSVLYCRLSDFMSNCLLGYLLALRNSACHRVGIMSCKCSLVKLYCKQRYD